MVFCFGMTKKAWDDSEYFTSRMTKKSGSGVGKVERLGKWCLLNGVEV